MPSVRTQAEYLGFVPSICPGQRIHLAENSSSPVINLAPQEQCDIEHRSPLVSATRTVEVELDIGLRFIPSETFENASDNFVIDVSAWWVARRPACRFDASLDQQVCGGARIAQMGYGKKVFAVGRAVSQASGSNPDCFRKRVICPPADWLRYSNLIKGERDLGLLSAVRTRRDRFDRTSK